MLILMREINGLFCKGSGLSTSSIIAGCQTRNRFRATGAGEASPQPHHSQLQASLPNPVVMLVAWKWPQWEYLHNLNQQNTKKSYFSQKWAVEYVPVHHCCRQKMTPHNRKNKEMVDWVARTVYSIRGKHANIWEQVHYTDQGLSPH